MSPPAPNLAMGAVQAAPKVWRYGNQQGHQQHLDTDLNSVVATVIVFLSNSGKFLAASVLSPCSSEWLPLP